MYRYQLLPFCVSRCSITKITGRTKELLSGPACYSIIGDIGLFKRSYAVNAHGNLRKIPAKNCRKQYTAKKII